VVLVVLARLLVLIGRPLHQLVQAVLMLVVVAVVARLAERAGLLVQVVVELAQVAILPLELEVRIVVVVVVVVAVARQINTALMVVLELLFLELREVILQFQ